MKQTIPHLSLALLAVASLLLATPAQADQTPKPEFILALSHSVAKVRVQDQNGQTGIGSGVVDRLKELELPVVGVNVAEAESPNANPEIQFNRLRDELWWKGREWLEQRDCKLLDDDDTNLNQL